MVSGRNGSVGAAEGRELIVEKNEREAHRGMHKGNVFSKPLAWKRTRVQFCEFLQQMGLKAWNFKGQVALLG